MSHIVDAHVAYIKAIADLSRDKVELLERIKRLDEENNELRAEEARLLNTNGELERRIKRLEEAYEGEIGEQPELLGSNVMGLLKRELNFAQKRIKRLEEAGDRMRLYCADLDDCFAWDRAKETKP